MTSELDYTDDREAMLERVLADYLHSVEAGQPLDQQTLLVQHAELADDLRSFFANREALEKLAGPLNAQAALEPTIGLHNWPAGSGERLRYFGDYELLDEIARGGMGVVYKARQVTLNRIVAVKMILAGQLAGDEDVKRFRAEAEAAAKLEHPQIVPIFEIGQQAGQHYFSMAFVDGESLAERLVRGVIAPKEAATLLLKVARAIAYAHGAGVVHRDLKPANILLDRAGDPRVTDFGLAMHLSRSPSLADSAAGEQSGRLNLTGTGQILGTPSYMSPEQATGKGLEIGPATDIYALGGVLYCLVTGRPPFQTASSVDTLLQVIHDEPASPRLLNPAVPRDLETICLKCLEKEPAARYRSAWDLADELERFLHDEPIRARPPDLAERAWRWLRKQRRSVGLTAAAVATTLVLAIGGLTGWVWFQDWRLGRVMLKTDHPPIAAELLDNRGELAGPKFTVPTQEPVAVAADEYRLRLSSTGRLSQQFETTVERGLWPATYAVNLEDQLIGLAKGGDTELRVERSYALIARQDHSGVVLLDSQGIRHAAWCEWSLPLDKPAEIPALEKSPRLRWPWYTNTSSYQEHAQVVFHPQVMRDAPDVDGDSISDVIVAARHQAWVLAVSVAKGEVLWLAARGKDLFAPDANAGQSLSYRNPSAVLGTPLVVLDRDQDGVPDLLALFADDQQKTDGAPRRWLECLSGKTGRTIWSFEFDSRWFELPPGIEPPDATRWFMTVNGWSSGGGNYANNHGEVYRDLGSERVVGESHPAPFPPTLVGPPDQPVAITLAGTRVVGIDVATGKPAWEPIDVGLPAVSPPQFVNLVGDRRLELLMVQPVPGKTVVNGNWNGNSANVPREARELTIAAWSLDDERKQLWQHVILAEPRLPWQVTSPPFPWPVAEDLNGDGRAEVMVPNRTWDASHGRLNPELEALDGATGNSRWRRPLKNMDGQIDCFLAGPDVNGDGEREVFAASLVGEKYDVYVDALSGTDGQTVWWSKQSSPAQVFLERLAWWHPGHDGWPQLLVTTVPEYRHSSLPQLYILSSATGVLANRAAGFQELQFADADGDGLTDLFTLQRSDPKNLSQGGSLQAIRGLAHECWRHLGGVWQAGRDYDGDGHSDLVAAFPSGMPQVAAISGSDGRQLWRTTLEMGPLSYHPAVHPLTHDLDGDATSDLIVYRGTTGGGSSGPHEKFPVAAVSGRTGESIWTVKMTYGALEGVLFVEARDLEDDGSPEIVFSTFTDWDYSRSGTISNSSNWSQHWLAVVDGRTGKFRWRKPLSVAYGSPGAPAGHADETRSADVRPVIADVNHDGTRDIIMPAEVANAPGTFELRASSGRDGSVLWQRLLTHVSAGQNSQSPEIRHFWHNVVTPAVVDFEGNGQTELIGLEYLVQPGQQRQVRLFALDAAHGTERWAWQSAVPENCGQAEEDRLAQAAKPKPLVIARQGKQPLVAIGLWGLHHQDQPGRVVLIDHTGQLVTETALDTRKAFRTWAYDVNEDGHDEVLVLDDKKLRAFQVSNAAGKYELVTLWERQLGDGTPYGVLDIVSATERDPATVVTQAGGLVHGVSATTGKPLWVTTGVQTPGVVGSELATSAQPLMSVAGRELPTTVFQWGDQMAACYLPRRLTEVSERRPGNANSSINPEATSSLRTPLSSTMEAAADPRWTRGPWWAQNPGYRLNEIMKLAWGAVLATLLFVIPGRTLYRMIDERRWNIRMLLLLPFFVGVMLCVLSLPVLPSFEPPYAEIIRYRLVTAIVAIPLLVFPWRLVQYVRNRRFRPLLHWGSAVLSLAAGIAAVTYAVSVHHLSPGERFSFTDWDLPLAFAFYVVACFATLFLGATVLYDLKRPRGTISSAQGYRA